MREHKHEHSIARMAKVLKVSESGYYKWLKRNDAPITDKEREDIALTEEILKIYRKSRGSFGYRKIKCTQENGHQYFRGIPSLQTVI